jgi:hypothetical protein
MLPGEERVLTEQTQRPLEDIISKWKIENSQMTPFVGKFKANKDEFLRKNDAKTTDLKLVNKGSVSKYPVAASAMKDGDLLYKVEFNGGYVVAIRGAGGEDVPRTHIRKAFMIGKKGYKQLILPGGDEDDVWLQSIAVLQLGKHTPALLETTLPNAHTSVSLLAVRDDGSIEQTINVGSRGEFHYADIDNDGIAEVITGSSTFDHVTNQFIPESLIREIKDAGCKYVDGTIRMYRYDIYKWEDNKLNREGFFYE